VTGAQVFARYSSDVERIQPIEAEDIAGSIMRVRRPVYDDSSEGRHQLSARNRCEPTTDQMTGQRSSILAMETGVHRRRSPASHEQVSAGRKGRVRGVSLMGGCTDGASEVPGISRAGASMRKRRVRVRVPDGWGGEIWGSRWSAK
jgi:hypothetical protein